MRIATTQVQGRVPVTILEVDGEVDATTYQQLIAQAREACDRGASGPVVRGASISDVGMFSDLPF